MDNDVVGRLCAAEDAPKVGEGEGDGVTEKSGVDPKDRHHYEAAWILVAEAAEETAAQMWPGMMDGKEALEMFASRIRVNSKFITHTSHSQDTPDSTVTRK